MGMCGSNSWCHSHTGATTVKRPVSGTDMCSKKMHSSGSSISIGWMESKCGASSRMMLSNP